jgi:N-acetyltransferase
MVPPLDSRFLSGSLVRLEPLSTARAPDLAIAADEDRSSYGFTWVPQPGQIDDYIASLLAKSDTEEFYPFAQVRQIDDRAIGCTAFGHLRRWQGMSGLSAVEIGWTWLSASTQGTGINKEAKLLLLTQAFEGWGADRVDIKTDARNEKSRRAIEGIGATFEGVLRNWSPSHAPGEDGRLRDSAMFSIVAAEWPSARAELLGQIRRIRDTG